MIESYYYGQGKVFTRKSGGKWRWWGDVSTLTLAAAVEKVEHRESYSGKKSLVRSFPNSTTMTLAATLHQIDTEALAEQLYGAASEIAAGTVTGEVLGNVAVGDIIKLAHGGIEDLVITDSLGSPATIADTHYEEDPRFGSIEFLSLPSGPAPTMPLKAAYGYAGGKQVNFMTQPAPVMEFRYEGINLAEGNAPVIVELYKLQTDPLQELALITDGNDVAGMQISASILLDSSKPALGDLGQFGRFRQVTMPA
ncbi:hypothetical protein [Caldimonas sp. KR1-144]|uniref:phage tail tube protein n=1 Tax=Caldimonas sp. KR1-144 TaxID=3400911 RepID=UPI003C0B396A